MKILYFLYSIFFTGPLLLNNVNAQNNIGKSKTILSGVVIDAETNKPIPYVEIFFACTTKGCISDELGKFNLKIPFAPCTLVADHISYDSFVTTINGNENNFTIKLKSKNITIDEVVVTGKNKWKKNLRFFYSRFIPNNRNQIDLVNDSVLRFKRNDSEFIAWTEEPLTVINRLLGYKIKMRIIQFKITRMDSPYFFKLPLKSSRGTEFVEMTAYYLYEPLDPVNVIQQHIYEENRRDYYLGSIRHLLKSVYSSNLDEQGFTMEIYPQNSTAVGFKEVINLNQQQRDNKTFFIDADSIHVTYHCDNEREPVGTKMLEYAEQVYSETSSIYSSNDIFTIRKNGTSHSNTFKVIGPLTKGSNMTNSLPEDYELKQLQ